MNIYTHGLEIIKNFISDSVIHGINQEVSALCNEYSKHGLRNADKKINSINEFANAAETLRLVSSILGPEVKIVRVIFFDKTPDKNWLVSWHQDKTIALNTKAEIDGWGPWSVKDGVHHVQPSLNVLNQMLTCRLHLDDADENNGCLKVIPASHKSGILAQSDISNIVNTAESYLCEVSKGDLLLMRPHLLHSSSKSVVPGHRRVVHIEYSSYDLPLNLKWA